MKIYIDFDDVICETGKHFTIIAKELFGIDLPYEQVKFFNLKQAFGLNDEQYDKLLIAGHVPATLLAYEETKDASRIINKWVDAGHEVEIITGRPFDSYGPSREWLDNHNLSRVPLYCVDKYGRENFNKDFSYSMTLSELYERKFDFAIEDSPAAFEHVMHFDNCKVAVYDRPWNENAEFPDNRFVRCKSWEEIDKLFEGLWIIKHIFDGDYGCEELSGEAEPRLTITLINAVGEKKIITATDTWLTERNLNEGDVWPEN